MPRGDRSTATREALIRAAASVFVSRGPHGARVRDIAARAGVTVPALYYHFEGTDALYERVITEGRARFLALFDAAIARRGQARDRLQAVADAYVEFGREDPVRLRLLCLELFRPRGDGEFDRGVEELNAHIRGALEDVLARGMDAGELPAADVEQTRRLFMALLNGLLLEQARDPDAPLLDPGIAARAVCAFLDGMGAVR
ncbi:MAG TPA: TetR/AcrR family transcriptional regulator [Candidatus Limnocylindria bacterium]|nr:TetR/AcrR family transcriptional regulator [Candidatus Limnocylindria bacterium]